VYHVLNRAVARLPLFQKPGDFEAFERVLAEALLVQPTRMLAYCLMPNHWHMVLWPEKDGDLTAFVRWLTHTHSMRWHAHYHTGGTGHIYQGRFKSFPVETEEYLYRVLRYVERNALRANLVSRAENWRWGSLWRRHGGVALPLLDLASWPVLMPENWVDIVNAPETEAELEKVRWAVARNRPFGCEAWCERTAEQLGLQATLRRQGRPRKQMSANTGTGLAF
jgi:putative transposase